MGHFVFCKKAFWRRKLTESWRQKFSIIGFKLEDVTANFLELFAMKKVKLKMRRKLVSSVHLYSKYVVVPQNEDVIDEEKKALLNISRLYLIDADKVQSKAYNVLLNAQEAAAWALNPGKRWVMLIRWQWRSRRKKPMGSIQI
ncbi:hypothetical protein AMTR_s00010p00114840 [Amborella trichopoda]|uniref:FACT complex subunit n=1 Tax=Amborella trichopoda TaxID=13333 RepID=W1NF40_AMBTC|nr:hypothetical protein AMTR_s00010p00114840 [Amborella trichopoda]